MAAVVAAYHVEPAGEVLEASLKLMLDEVPRYVLYLMCLGYL